LRAAQVASVNQTEVVIEAAVDEGLKVNEIYFAMDGKRKVGLIQIVAADEFEVKGRLTKGRAAAGYPLVKVQKKGTAVKKTAAKPGSTEVTRWGLHAAFMNNSFNVQTSTASVDMTGTGFAAGLVYEDVLMEDVFWQGQLNFRQFTVESKTSDCVGGPCNLDVSYLSVAGTVNYLLSSDFFVGLAYEYMSPMSKTSRLLSEDQIQSNSVAAVNLGYFVSREFPVTLSYSTFLSNKNITASFISLQMTYLWPF